MWINPRRVNGYTERYEDDQNPALQQDRISLRKRWTLDTESGQFVTWKATNVAGGIQIETAAGTLNVQFVNNLFMFGDVNMIPELQKQTGGSNFSRVNGNLQGVTQTLDTPDDAEWRWDYNHGLYVTFRITDGIPKWGFGWNRSGVHRIKLDFTATQADDVELYRRKRLNTEPIGTITPLYGLSWKWLDAQEQVVKSWSLNFRQALDEITDFTATVGQAQLLTTPATDSYYMDPTFGPQNANYSTDVDSSARYYDDGADWCGEDGSAAYRFCCRFDITSLPAANTVSQVDCTINVLAVTGAGSDTWILGPYDLAGQTDPSAGTAAQCFSRCDVSGDNYLTGLTDFRTTGNKTFTALGSTANSDVEAARDAGTIYSLAVRMTNESVARAAAYAEFDEFNGTTPPSLTVTHSSGAGGGLRAGTLGLTGVGI